MHDKKEKYLDWAIIALLAVLILLVANNQVKLNNLSEMSATGFAAATGVKTAEASVIPTGIPKIYGSEMGISYDDISPYDQQKADLTIRKLGNLDDATQLSQDEMKRYISIASKISCEYCCGAESIIFSNGDAACGCAHSYAMRGLAKYLLTNYINLASNKYRGIEKGAAGSGMVGGC